MFSSVVALRRRQQHQQQIVVRAMRQTWISIKVATEIETETSSKTQSKSIEVVQAVSSLFSDNTRKIHEFTERNRNTLMKRLLLTAPICALLPHFPLITHSFSTTPSQSQKNQLFPYQREGVQRLLEGKRMLLADEMGLGKTVQCISAINELNHSIPHPTILIICPKSVLGVWEDELQRWLVNTALTIRVATTKEFVLPTKGSITIINYDICHKLQTALQSVYYDILICDEAHYMKSRTAKRTLAVVGNGKRFKGIQANYLWLLTGTPILNRPVELFPLLQAMDPLEAGSFDEYAKKYCDPKNIGQSYAMDYSGASNLQELSKQLQPRLIRRYKTDVLTQLPPKLRSCLCLPGSEVVKEQERQMLHELMKNDGLKLEEDLEDFGAEATSLMTYLSEKTKLDLNDPKNRNRILGILATIRQETALNKLVPAVELLENVILSQKVVVFCHHRELISRLLETFGDQAVSIVGGMDRESRADAVQRFQQDDQVRLFIGSIHAAGIGITLTAASHVVFLELDWSPAVMSQAEDRCHRVGQTNSVQVQYYVFKDTIDEWIARSLLLKQSNIDQILPEAGSTQTGYVFDFGKYKDIRLQDVPRGYLSYLVKNDLWMTRPNLWQALFQNGMVFKTPPSNDSQKDTVFDQRPQDKSVNFTFNFGKHNGLKWEDTPPTYREWIIREGVWKDRPTMRSALAAAGLVREGLDKSDNRHHIPDVPF